MEAGIVKNRMSISDFEQRFPTEAACAKFVEEKRWAGQLVCPHCDHTRVYRVAGPMGFKCSRCRKRFSVRTGNAMEHSKLSLRTWLLAVCMLTAPARPRRTLLSWLLALYMTNEMRGSLSLDRFAEQLDVTHKTALSLVNRIRRACGDGARDAPDRDPPTDRRRAAGKRKKRDQERTIAQLSETFAEAAAKVIGSKPGQSG